MNKIKILLIIFIINLKIVTFANSQELTSIRGHMSCGEFLKYCEKNTLDLNCQTQTFFALGYMSAITYHIEGVLFSADIFKQDNIKYSLINYCKSNPFKDTHHGAISVYYNELLPLRSK